MARVSPPKIISQNSSSVSEQSSELRAVIQAAMTEIDAAATIATAADEEKQVISAVYDRRAPFGVILRRVPRPTLSGTRAHITRQLTRGVISLAAVAVSTVFTAARIISLRSSRAPLPPPRPRILCRVHCAGINPVDAKLLYGDKESINHINFSYCHKVYFILRLFCVVRFGDGRFL